MFDFIEVLSLKIVTDSQFDQIFTFTLTIILVVDRFFHGTITIKSKRNKKLNSSKHISGKVATFNTFFFFFNHPMSLTKVKQCHHIGHPPRVNYQQDYVLLYLTCLIHLNVCIFIIKHFHRVFDVIFIYTISSVPLSQ